MDKKDLIRKLTSRKFWVALCGFVAELLGVLNFDPGSTEQITSLIMAGATVIAYIFAEGFIDATRVEGDE